MLTKNKLLTLLAENNRMLVDLLWGSEAAALEPAPEPPAPRKLRPCEQPGIDMNTLLRSCEKSKPPRAPGTQILRFNGIWHYWK